MKNKKTLIILIVILLLMVLAALAWIFHLESTDRPASGKENVQNESGQTAEDEQKKAEEEAAAREKAEISSAASHVYSHRGTEGPEEHTFKAYDAAIEAGSRYIEQDVVISADKVLYVSHDENALAMTGYNGMYEYMTSETIDSLETEAGNKILRLSEVFDRYGKDINYVIELKSNSDACIMAFEELVEEYGLSDVITVQSMHADTLKIIENKYPDMPKLFVCWNQGDFNYVLDLPYVDIISVRATVETGILTESNCKAAHDAGKKFSAWTLSTEDEIKRAIDMGVDTYFTNDTPLALSIEKDYGLKVRNESGESEED